MRESFDKKLNTLNIKLLDMAAMTEQIIAMSVKSIEERNEKLARDAIAFDDKINECEREIERMCLNILLQYQPVFAVDLRRVSAALKMVTDMERIGDQSQDIAELNLQLLAARQEWDIKPVSKMAQSATKMVTEAIDAYINNDEVLAQTVINEDDIIDGLFNDIKKQIIEQIADNKADGDKAIDTLMVAKYLEKIGDHAVNIAEWVQFSITGVHKQERIM